MDRSYNFLEPCLTVISLNVEGFTTVKEEIISELCKQNNCHVLYLQETHRGIHKASPKIKGMKIIFESPHNR